MKTRTDFRVGDKVFCFGLGNGAVSKVSSRLEETNYPVAVQFESDECCSFTSDGRRYAHEEYRCLFHGEMPVIPQEWTIVDDTPKLSHLNIDDKIMVSETGHIWLKRRFAGIDRTGMATAFADGADMWGSGDQLQVSWKLWRLPTEEELKH